MVVQPGKASQRGCRRSIRVVFTHHQSETIKARHWAEQVGVVYAHGPSAPIAARSPHWNLYYHQAERGASTVA